MTPVWIQGTLLPEAQEAMRGFPGFWIVGRVNAGLVPSAVRYDQALSATGDITVDGEIRSFVGHGLRGDVRGVRKMDHFRSHAWMEAVFPDSGMAFGIQAHCSDVYGGRDMRSARRSSGRTAGSTRTASSTHRALPAKTHMRSS